MTAAPKISSNVPTAMRKQVKEANRLMEELNARPGQMPRSAEEAAAAGAGGGAAAPTSPVKDLPTVAGGAVPPGFKAVDLTKPTVAAVTAAPTAAAAAAAPVAPAPSADEQRFQRLEHSHNVLMGKYNAETGRLMGIAQALKDQNDQLLQQLAQARVAGPSAPVPTVVTASGEIVTAKQREEYGEELLGIMERIAKANSGGAAQAEINAVKTELEKLKGAVRVTVQAAVEGSHERCWAALAAWRPDWQAINVSTQFVDWLDQIDVVSGQPRKAGLMAAFGEGNAQRVVGIFKRYVEEDSRTAPTAVATAPAVDAATLVAPGASRGGGGGEAPSGTSGKIWSEQEIDDFYSRVQRKRISADEAKATEAEIQKALREGRIMPRHTDRHLSNHA